MKPTADDADPRRDGWFEHKAEWGEVQLGTVIATAKRSERWEIIDIAMGHPVPPGETLWMKAREQTTGAEFAIHPRLKNRPVTILTQDPADTVGMPVQPPSDADAIMLLVQELGAETMASRDNVTGEIVCPDYIERSHLTGAAKCRRGLVEHMALAHGHPVDEDLDIGTLASLHGQAHDPRWPNIGKSGFPHRHVPDIDLSMFG